MSDESIPPARAHGERLQTTDGTAADAPSTAPGAEAEAEAGIGPRRRRGVALGIAAAAIVAVIAAPLGALAVSDTRGTAEVSLDTAGGMAGSAAASGSEPAADLDGVDLHIAPTVDTTITPGAPLAISVEIENSTAEALAPGTVRLTRADGPIDSSGELDAWLGTEGDADEQPIVEPVLLLEAESRAVAAGSTAVVSFTVPADALGAADDGAVLGLGAEIVVDGMLVASSGEAFATSTASASDPTSLAIVYPLTVPAESAGIFTAEQLEGWTAPLGLLDRQLDAVAGKQVAVGIDPRIIASIRVLGSAAPASATQWLARLGALPNETFPLAYADADVALQAQLELPELLAPTTFSDLLDPGAFTDIEPPPVDSDETATPTPTADPAAEPTPDPADPADGVPTTEAILAWPYTRTDIAWPADDTIASGDLGYLDAAGLTTAIVAPGNVTPLDGRLDASSSIEESTAVVADAGLTSSLRAASTASTEIEWRSAAGRLLAELAIDAGSGRPVTMLATFDRGAYANADRVADTIDEVTGNPWVVPAGLSDAIGAPPVARALVDEPEDDQRRVAAGRMIAVEAEITEFATVLDDPRLLTGPVRRDLLAMLDVGWLGDPVAWNTAVNTWLTARRTTLDSVSVVPSSSVLVVARESPLPTTVLNALPFPATVIVSADPSNGRLIVEDSVEVTVGAESRSNVQVPIAAGVGRGEVTLAVSLSSPTGVPVGETVNIEANVQADWEGLGATILAIAVALFFGFGIWRNIRRRRRQRAEAADEASEPTDDATRADSGQPEPEASDSVRVAAAPADPDATDAEASEMTEEPGTDRTEPRND